MKINKDSIIKILDSLYDNAIDGLPGAPSVEELGNEYIKKENGNIEKSINSLIRWQTTKASSAGFASGFGGKITLPITLPFGIAFLLYNQLRMVATIAHLCGLDTSSDQVKTFVYCALLGDGATKVLKDMGVKVGEKLTQNLISSMSRDVLVAINRAVGFRLVTKFGEKGVINLGKYVPFVGGVVGGSIDGIACYHVGKSAKKLFYDNDGPNSTK
ncbi:MAG: EcsC family protein [Bacteriovoracales bacterium]|nr:EcsC family protein [Bacteriovoracales bacterium]